MASGTLVRERSAARVGAEPTGGWRVPVGYVLRHGLVHVCAAILVGVMVAALAMRGAPWRGDLVWTLDWFAISHIAVGPILAGFVGVDSSRLTVGMEHLRTGYARRAPDRGIALAYWALASAVYLLVVVGALVVSLPPRWDWAVLGVLVIHVLILGVHVMTGLAAGRLLRPLVAGAAAALVALLLTTLFTTGKTPMAFLAAGGATVPRLGYRYNVSFLVAQAVVLAVVIVVLVLARRTRREDGMRSRLRPVAIVALAALGIVGVGNVPVGARLLSSPVTPDLCGAVLTVPTCFYAEHERLERPFQDQLYRLFMTAEQQGYDALIPARVEEASRTYLPQGAGVAPLFVSGDHLAGREPDLWEVTMGLVEPIHCPQLSGGQPPSDKYGSDLMALAATWAMLVDPSAGEELFGYVDEPLTPEAAEKLYTEFRTCTHAF